MRKLLKRLAGLLSERRQQSLKRFMFARQIRRGTFRTEEPEFRDLDAMLSEGDWAIDVGANVGHYTMRMSQLVKSGGRILAFEPIPATFELLAANSALSPYRNVTLFNAAASNSVGLASMAIPEWDRGGRLNYYEAHITSEPTTTQPCTVFTLRIDDIDLPHRVSLVKIDAEGHELQVVRGMERLIERDRPVLVVEGDKAGPVLEAFGYVREHRPGSPNDVWRCRERIAVDRPLLSGSQDETSR